MLVSNFRSICNRLLFRIFGCKDSAKRVQYKKKMQIFIFIAELQPVLSKDSAKRVQYKKNANFYFYCRVAAYLIQR